MKRDMELIRKIMLEIEKNPSAKPILNLKIDGYDSRTVASHCKLLHQKGFLESFKANPADDDPYYFYWVGNLTVDGYDYLDKIRDDSFWGKIKAYAKENGWDLTIKIVEKIIGVIG